MIAYKNDRVSRVAPIFYLESVFSLIYDYFIFSISFGVTQMTGIIMVFTMFAAKIIVALREK